MQDGYVKVMASCFIWGTLGVFARWSHSDPLSIAYLRCLTATCALCVFFLWRKHLPAWPDGKSLLLVSVSGMLNAAGNVFFFTAIGLTTLAHTLFVYYLGPVFIVILAPLALKEPVEIKNLVALSLSLCGFLLIINNPAGAPITSEIKGLLFALSGAACFSLMILIAKALKRMEALSFTFYQMMVASICLWPFVPYPRDLSLNGTACIVILGLFHTAFAYSSYYAGLKQIKMQHAGILLYLDPVVAAIMGYLLFHEMIGLHGCIGGTLIILSGIIVVTGRGYAR